MADHERGQLPALGDVDESHDYAFHLLLEGFAPGVPPPFAGVLPGLELGGRHVGVGDLRPVAGVRLGEAVVDDRLEAHALADDRRGLAGPGQRAAVQRDEVLAGRELGQLAGLGAPLLGEHGLRAPTLEAALGVERRLPVAGEEDHVVIVSERRPRRSVSSERTSSGAMLPRFTSAPKRSMNHTCWSLRGASKIIREGSTAWAISSMRPIRTSPSWRKMPTVPDSRASAMTFQAPASSSASIFSTHLYGAMIFWSSLEPTSLSTVKPSPARRRISSRFSSASSVIVPSETST